MCSKGQAQTGIPLGGRDRDLVRDGSIPIQNSSMECMNNAKEYDRAGWVVQSWFWRTRVNMVSCM